jgi:Flp pilus assembly protein TadG
MLLKPVRDFAAHEGGNYAVIFALAAMPLMAGVGVSMDYVQASSMESELARSLEQAWLVGANQWLAGKPLAEAGKTIKGLILANIGQKYADALKVQVSAPYVASRKARVFRYSATFTYKPLLAPLYAAVTGGAADDYDYVIKLPGRD